MALEISIDDQAKLFSQHLEEVGNDRIIFSGAFGTGKTYFLDKYFKASESKYLAIRLFPVNYSVSNNEDIFQLIKYDILFELAAIHKIALEGEKINWDVALGVTLPAKAESIVQSLLPLLPLLNKPTDAIPVVLAALTAWLATGKEITKQRKEASKETEVISFGEAVAAKYQLESDYVTTFLENGLNKVAAERNKVGKVLIIDDLDRIDPEHIFRLFNIFSAHLDYNKEPVNKFAFDKVIFVCDVRNIRNIFHTRYGMATDFAGYIDKFYSTEVYFFSNIEEIKKSIDLLIGSLKFEEKHLPYFQDRILKGDRKGGQSLLALVLVELVHSQALTIRRIIASSGLSYKMPTESLGLTAADARDVKAWQVPAAITLDLLSRILGGSDVLSQAVKRLKSYKRSGIYTEFSTSNSDWLVGVLLPILDHANHQFATNADSHSYQINSEQSIEYTLTEYGHHHDYYYGNINSINGASYKRQHIPFFDTFSKAIRILQQSGMLK